MYSSDIQCSYRVRAHTHTSTCTQTLYLCAYILIYTSIADTRFATKCICWICSNIPFNMEHFTIGTTPSTCQYFSAIFVQFIDNNEKSQKYLYSIEFGFIIATAFFTNCTKFSVDTHSNIEMTCDQFILPMQILQRVQTTKWPQTSLKMMAFNSLGSVEIELSHRNFDSWFHVCYSFSYSFGMNKGFEFLTYEADQLCYSEWYICFELRFLLWRLDEWMMVFLTISRLSKAKVSDLSWFLSLEKILVELTI